MVERSLCRYSPTIKDRIVKTLYLFALDPITEKQADTRLYGFCMYHEVPDCVTYLILVCSSYTATRLYVLDADIEQFFLSLSHQWLLDNTVIDRGFLQESPISPALINMSLNKLQEWFNGEFLFVRYAGDFLVLGKNKQALNENALFKIGEFFEPKGSRLNQEKTQIKELK